MSEQISWNIKKACCFTGHRNRDLPFGGNRNKQGMKCLVSSLQLFIENAVDDGYDTFISGMAEGIDLICAEIVHNLITRKGFDIKLICAIPYKNQGAIELSSPLDQYIYNLVIQDCETIYVSDKKSSDCYRKRNQFMVEHSSRIIGVVDSDKRRSGSFQTINMAKKAGLEQKILYINKNPVFFIDDNK